MFSLRKEINLINTQKEKQDQLAVRRRALLASQNALTEEIDAVINLNQAKKRVHKPKLRGKKMKYILGLLVALTAAQLYSGFFN